MGVLPVVVLPVVVLCLSLAQLPGLYLCPCPSQHTHVACVYIYMYSEIRVRAIAQPGLFCSLRFCVKCAVCCVFCICPAPAPGAGPP